MHGAATMAALPTADAVLLVSDASQEYTAPELEFLRQAVRLCPNVACVLTKTDLYPQWRRIAELDRGHLRTRASTPACSGCRRRCGWQAVSPATRRSTPSRASSSWRPTSPSGCWARPTCSAAGPPCTTSWPSPTSSATPCAPRRRRRTTRSASQELIARATEAQAGPAALKERSARWQHTLNDGVADLNADIDHDLRDRMREITRLAEEEIDEGGDPTRVWEQLADVGAAAGRDRRPRRTSSGRPSGPAGSPSRSRQHFDDQREAVLPALRTEASAALGSVREMTVRDGRESVRRWATRRSRACAAATSACSCSACVGTIVGLEPAQPDLDRRGLLLGGKTISDERRRMVAAPAGRGEEAVRRYVDEVTFQVGKDSRDMLREVQRDLRDHFTALAEQLNRSLKESLHRRRAVGDHDRARRSGGWPRSRPSWRSWSGCSSGCAP